MKKTLIIAATVLAILLAIGAFAYRVLDQSTALDDARSQVALQHNQLSVLAALANANLAHLTKKDVRAVIRDGRFESFDKGSDVVIAGQVAFTFKGETLVKVDLD